MKNFTFFFCAIMLALSFLLFTPILISSGCNSTDNGKLSVGDIICSPDSCKAVYMVLSVKSADTYIMVNTTTNEGFVVNLPSEWVINKQPKKICSPNDVIPGTIILVNNSTEFLFVRDVTKDELVVNGIFDDEESSYIKKSSIDYCQPVAYTKNACMDYEDVVIIYFDNHLVLESFLNTDIEIKYYD